MSLLYFFCLVGLNVGLQVELKVIRQKFGRIHCCVSGIWKFALCQKPLYFKEKVKYLFGGVDNT